MSTRPRAEMGSHGPLHGVSLGGGKGGIGHLMRHIGVTKAAWLETMARWAQPSKTEEEKAVRGVEGMTGGRPVEELERWRDERLVSILKLLREKRF